MDSNSRLIKLAILTATMVTLVVIAAVVAFNWQEVAERLGLDITPPIVASLPPETDPGFTTPGLLPGADPKAFLRDADFFDSAPVDAANITVTYGRTANLVLSSIEKDLRIHIVDILGRNIKGEEWSVMVDGIEYRDRQKSGVIHIRPMNVGVVTVSLNPLTGYRTQQEEATIAIRQQIEYVALNERDLRILTEAQIDESIEDTVVRMADEDRDGSEFTEPLGTWSGAQFGIDVSKWQREIDWHRVKEAGVEFVIIRVGYRGWTSGSLVEDPYFAANIRGATEAGIAVGVYFFTQAVNVLEAIEEASMAIALVEGYHLDFPIFIDTEGTGTGGRGRADNLSVEVRTEVCRAFMETVRSAGYLSGLYAARNWLYNQLDMSRLDEHIVWLAEYRDIPRYSGYYQMWQYSSRGSIDGIEGNVDLNLSYLF
ncbi:MAG: glycoside hydrolase family 25 protein [Lachnospiraceae bacterium]|jgi:GH25 family lysozyme M1 (1,4-beta-N-acetylmuramidase)|nr:glycoside hydrolase family 25 protein [Lachnospiraceae bacterium]